MHVRSWLRREPIPSLIRCDNGRTVSIGLGKRKWADAEDAIMAIGAVTIEALDEKGNLLRTCSLKEEDGEIEAAPAPKTPGKQQTETVAELVHVVGQIYRDAYKQAYDASSQTITSLTQMNANLSAQLAGTQNAFLSAINTLAEERMAAAEQVAAGEGDGIMGQIVAAAAGGMLEPPKPAAKANGAPVAPKAKGH